MNVPFLVMWAMAAALWLYALVPFSRLKRHLTQERRDGLAPPGSTDLARMRLILADRRHPLHRDARRMMAAYGGFLFCWIVGFGLHLLPPATH